jgi:hypothetical protein
MATIVATAIPNFRKVPRMSFRLYAPSPYDKLRRLKICSNEASLLALGRVESGGNSPRERAAF